MSVLSLDRLRCAFRLGGISPGELAREVYRQVDEHEILTRAAAIAYYAFSALVPFLVVVVTIIVLLLPTFFGEGSATLTENPSIPRDFDDMLTRILPREGVLIVENQVARLRQAPPVGLISVGLAISLWLSSSLFVEVIAALNRIYGAAETRPWWRLRLLALLLTLIVATVTVGSLVVISLWPQIEAGLGLSEWNARSAALIQWVAVLAALSLSFAFTFYVAPNTRQHWEWITPGGLLGTIGFILSSLVFRLYVQRFGAYDKTYGSLGGIIVLLMWLWIVAIIVLVSGQVNAVIRDRCSGHRPA